MLVQSHLGWIHLLPALPSAWADGRVRGLRVRGGFELGLEWSDGALRECSVKRVVEGLGRCVVRYRDGEADIHLANGETRVLATQDFAR
jgi:alpha-L-fucosidase 2